jgi:hypothetical protein
MHITGNVYIALSWLASFMHQTVSLREKADFGLNNNTATKNYADIIQNHMR